MKEPQSSAIVDIEQNERRAADVAWVAPQPAEQPADELRLAGAKLSLQRDALAAVQRMRQCGGKRLSLIGAVGKMRHGTTPANAPILVGKALAVNRCIAEKFRDRA